MYVMHLVKYRSGGVWVYRQYCPKAQEGVMQSILNKQLTRDGPPVWDWMRG